MSPHFDCITDVPADITSRVLLWKFQYFDSDRDNVLLPPEEENVNNEIYSFVKCTLILPQIDSLMDTNSDNQINLSEWSAFFN